MVSENENEIDYDTFHGLDVNDFRSTVTYGIFNDPQVWDSKFGDPKLGMIPESMREQLLETPLFEDDKASRVLRHARMTNEDRRQRGTLDRDGMVIIKRQITLQSDWVLDVQPIDAALQKIEQSVSDYLDPQLGQIGLQLNRRRPLV